MSVPIIAIKGLFKQCVISDIIMNCIVPMKLDDFSIVLSTMLL
jgi:hypothetical protein